MLKLDSDEEEDMAGTLNVSSTPGVMLLLRRCDTRHLCHQGADKARVSGGGSPHRGG